MVIPMSPMRKLVAAILRSHAPPEAGDMFRSIVGTELEASRSGEAVIVADLVMFDGRPGRVRLEQFSLAGCISWSSEWLSLPGGHCHCENGKWVRLGDDKQPVLPLFEYAQ